MMVSPFTFYRGAAKIMAADLKDTPVAGLDAQLCGDAHLSNFGMFASPERALLFDLNDFDETLPGPFEFDVKRIDLVRERRWARLESARTDVTEAPSRSGSYAGSRAWRHTAENGLCNRFRSRIPTSASKGTLRILVSDGDTLDHIGRTNAAFGRELDLASTISLLNRGHSNNRVYVSLLEADPEARVGR